MECLLQFVPDLEVLSEDFLVFIEHTLSRKHMNRYNKGYSSYVFGNTGITSVQDSNANGIIIP